MFYTRSDKDGAYVDLPDDDVCLMKQGEEYIYRIRGDAISKLARLEHLELMLELKESLKGGL